MGPPEPTAVSCAVLWCAVQVRCHPWFTAHLPRYLAVMQADTAVNTPRLDEEMITEVNDTSSTHRGDIGIDIDIDMLQQHRPVTQAVLLG